ncbi:MAG: NADH-quinone oxidoreductase subunit M [Gammaproteobacteria bacterium]|jgi:NADH-quinone oxidoreductase subunit M
MMLTVLILVLLVGGVVAWVAGHWHRDAPRWIALLALVVDFAVLLFQWRQGFVFSQHGGETVWLAQETYNWIPRFGIHYQLAMDGLSLWLSLLAVFLGIAAVLTSWREIQQRTGFFHFNILWTLAGVLGVFLALDLFLFFVFWEVMLVPMYFIIAIWGHERRVYSALKFFIFTQASGLLMLVAILALVFAHYQSSGVISFDYNTLLHTELPAQAAYWMMLGFFIAFAVKLPVVPFHPWLPDAHTEAPTAGSVILAGVLLKTGAYGLLRFVVPLFPEAAAQFAPVAMTLGVIGIIYGAVLAFAQTDLKRLVAYTSVSHMGFIVIGIFAWNTLALQGVLIQMIAHGLSTGALFMIVGQLQERIHTRDMRQMGGLWNDIPRLGALALFFAIASLGLPGLANFVGEVTILLGAFPVNHVLTICAALGLIGAAIYALYMMQRTFFGQGVVVTDDTSQSAGGRQSGRHSRGQNISDAAWRETAVLLSIIVLTVWLGLNPNPVFKTAEPAFGALQQAAGTPPSPAELAVAREVP